jgi:CelD/BcsL family acetyltransferase involved in cellulose biosynthesis
VTVSVIETAEGLAALAPAWRALSDRAVTAHLFNDVDWLSAWWAAFAGPQDRLRIYALHRGARLIAVLPTYCPAPAGRAAPRRLAALFNHYLGRTDALLETPAEGPALLAAVLADRGRWDVAELSQVPEDSPFFGALAAPPAGLSAYGVRNIASPFLDLPAGGYEAWYAARFSAKKRQQDRRRQRQAEKQGALLEVLTDPARVTAAFEAGLEVEALGWKGEQASAMKSRPETAAFMRDVVARFAARGAARLVTLATPQQQVAFLLGFVHGGCLYFHKTGFDPAWEATSPGRLVLLASIEDAFGLGLARYDFLGAADPYKLQCSPTVRPHATVFLYHRGLRSRVLREVKRTAVPLARRVGRGGPALPVRVDR